nr:MAG TPA: hypothetical protein [Caudoviricetes sp.]
MLKKVSNIVFTTTIKALNAFGISVDILQYYANYNIV